MASPVPEKVDVGSSTWIGADDVEEDSEFAQRSNKFLREIKWDCLTKICSERRNIPCQLSEKFSIGHFNMVRQIVFQDGMLWIARLRMPALENGAHLYPDLERAMSSEVAYMKFLKAQSSIPVPEVYHFEPESNDVGAPYMLMEYIHGTVASELQDKIDAPCNQFGTPEQDQKFRRKMAAIQVEMASLQFDKIGSLYQDAKTGDFYIGRDCQTGKGPWESSLEYYHSLAEQRLEESIRNAPKEVQDDRSFNLPRLFQQLIPMYTEEKSVRGPFGLAHTDFGPHNLLVNENFDILAMFDFKGVIAGPLEVQAQFPFLAGLDVHPPFVVETKPLWIAQIKETRPKLEEYKRMVQELERQTETPKDTHNLQKRPGDLLLSQASTLITGLQEYSMHQDFVNQRWMLSFERLLQEKPSM